MKPIKAWAVLAKTQLHYKGYSNMSVFPTRGAANDYVLFNESHHGRIVEVEIRERTKKEKK